MYDDQLIGMTRKELENIIERSVKKALDEVRTWNESPDDRFTSAQAAEYLNIKPQTLRSWRQDSRGPRYQKDGPHGRVYYLRSELEKYAQSNIIHTVNSSFIKQPFSLQSIISSDANNNN